ncbi:MAG: hypothetical protein WAL35_02790 [Acidimicrobiales bacterium]
MLEDATATSKYSPVALKVGAATGSEPKSATVIAPTPIALALKLPSVADAFGNSLVDEALAELVDPVGGTGGVVVPPPPPLAPPPPACGLTVKLFEEPSAARYSVPAATCAVSVQVPTPTKSTVNSSDSTVQTSVVDEVTEVDPSPSVLTDAVKLPP